MKRTRSLAALCAAYQIAQFIHRVTGNLSEDHEIPPYYSLGEARSVRLEYNSTAAAAARAAFAATPGRQRRPGGRAPAHAGRAGRL